MRQHDDRQETAAALAKAHRNFWILTGVAVIAVGSLSDALRATPGPITAAVVAVSGLVAASAVALAARVLIALSSGRRGTR